MSHNFIQDGVYQALPVRKISEETCRKFGYTVATLSDGRKVQVAPIYDPETRELIGQKVRPKEKDETFAIGKVTGALFGQNLWAQGGRKIVITEGEIDCMSVSQAQGNKYPVVSVPNGAAGAAKAVAKQLDWLSSFEEVIFMFDMDKPGQDAAAECAGLFDPGKAKIASLPRKDANEVLVLDGSDGVRTLINAVFNAKPYSPDGLITINDIYDQAITPPVLGIAWAWDIMTAWTYGRRPGECYGFGAGTGVGKSDLFTQQVEYDLNTLHVPVGMFMLEQNPVETVWRLAGKMEGKSFHVPDGTWTNEELVAAVDKLRAIPGLHLYQSFGRNDWALIKSRIRYLAVAHGVRHIYLDHLTALADPAKERETLEIIMEEMASMANELGLIFHYVSHLSTPEGKSHEEGGRVLSKHFKGSRAIAFWTHYMFGLERDKLADDPVQRTIATLRCIKDRMTGRADGETMLLRYDRATCRLVPYVAPPPQEAFAASFTAEDDADDEAPF
ncbi:toprim domain-containing protein [Phenylobacterium sp.]|uniref:toprim domain-containing protein n=1 Tax=Phenylobacterium sp. TaxID=1871053 RepID=UPI002737C66C|nr:toprim domain-containing protein [Phenylobacterium sp.]MDP3869908.1 toprim domain-containing protein [Phenylobacterium sp.]